MLEELDIKNFALIDSAHVEFNKGFTVLSGETGAGKSILIGSLAFLLGGKAGLEQIRTGTTEAQVSGLFRLEERGIQAEDERILLRRIIRDSGKTSAWIGGVMVTKSDLLSFSSFLVDIHGQHEQQSLMKVSEHRRYLDIYAGIEDKVKAFTLLYNDLVDKRHKLESINTDSSERANRIEMLSFAIEEIEEAKLKEGEDKELLAEESKLSSFEKLYSDIEEINSAFEAEEGGGSLLSILKRIKSIAPHASSLDNELTPLENRLQSAFYELEDIAQEYRHYASSLVFDPERLEVVQERLKLISKLKKKYCGNKDSDIPEILEYQRKASEELEALSNITEDKSALERLISDLEAKVYSAAKELNALRRAASDKMSAAIENILADLGMASSHFKVSITEKDEDGMVQKCGPYGMDNVEFLISANLGSPLLPLARIASGGELSRVMLALKTILSDGDKAGTLVFDEIDTGIGGEIAVSLGKHMKMLACKKQILCITHLASIAVYADNQLKIRKGVENGGTATEVFPVEGQERVKEIARMLAGDSVSQASLEHAASMLRNVEEV